MNSLTSSSKFSEPVNVLHKLANHENFVIDGIKIRPELVECAEHFVLACSKNPGFVSKIINAEYDLLIGDDVSGRPVTLMIKYIIDHYRKRKGLDKNAKCIFIDNPLYIKENYTSAIISKYKKILVCTENIIRGTTMNKINSNLKLAGRFDIFTQALRDGSIGCFVNSNSAIYGVLKDGSMNKIYMPKIEENKTYAKEYIGLSSMNGKYGFAGKVPEYDPNKVKEYRDQIKLLSQYIIQNYLKT